MKNRYDYKNADKIKQSCNEWCCPCNEGRGCQANDFCVDACDNSFYNKTDKWNILMEMAYDTMSTTAYDEICRRMYEYAEGI